MTDDEIERVAHAVWTARLDQRTLTTDEITRPPGTLTMAEAYQIQARNVQRRIERGERHVGWKLGYTSEAMRRQMGVEQPNYGPLTDAMVLPDGATVPVTVTQPRVEPEIAIRLGRDLHPPVTVDTVADSIDAALACLEVVDSVWTDYSFRIEHNTADGSSAACVVLGAPIQNPDLAATTVRLLHNGAEVSAASGSAASGHPLAGVVWLAARLAESGQRLLAGEIVITGGLTAAIPLGGGDAIEAIFDSDVSVSVRRAPQR